MNIFDLTAEEASSILRVIFQSDCSRSPSRGVRLPLSSPAETELENHEGVPAAVSAAYATSHAFALESPLLDAFRQRNESHYGQRFGHNPGTNPALLDETYATNLQRYRQAADALDEVRQALRNDPPDALVIIANDQKENLTRAVLPQVAIYTGGDFLTSNDPLEERRAAPVLAAGIYEHVISCDVDVAAMNAFPDRSLIAHAYIRFCAASVRRARSRSCRCSLTRPLPSARHCALRGVLCY